MADDAIIDEGALDALSQQEKRPPYATSSIQLYADLAVPSEFRSIRLLDLQAAPNGQDEAPLVGHLRVARLRDRPAFTTLSYAWGLNTSPSPKITCLPHRIDLEITRNCFQALWHIRNCLAP